MKIKKAEEVIHKLPKGRSLENYPYALSDEIFHTKQLFIHSEKVGPGRKSSAPHFHSSIDEVIHITKGELQAFEGDESTKLVQGDSICFLANSNKKHYLENQSDSDAEFLLIRKTFENEDAVF